MIAVLGNAKVYLLRGEGMTKLEKAMHERAKMIAEWLEKGKLSPGLRAAVIRAAEELHHLSKAAALVD